MLDIHCHILPATDDGPNDLAESLEVARLAVADGISDIVATPHHHRWLRLLHADILPRVAALNSELERAGIAVKIWPGSEIQLYDIPAYRADYDAGVLCHLGDAPDYSLLEWPWDARDHGPREAELEQIAWLRERGTRPIIAHPERMTFFSRDLERLDDLVSEGAWLQITASALWGEFGDEASAAALTLLRRFPEIVVATDTHHLRRRSGLMRAYEIIADAQGPERADDIRARTDGIATSFAPSS